MYSEDSKKYDYRFLAFIPLILFLAIYLGGGLLFTVIGIEKPFGQIPREAALIFALTTAILMGKGTLDFKMDVFAKSAGESGNLLMCAIFLSAGAFAGVAKAMGGVDATVHLGLSLIPIKFIFVGVFIISAFIATAMGTSMGTIAAIGPIALGLSEKANISSSIAIAAVLCGAIFGDNLSIISDTTIAATRGAGCKMNEKFKMNLLIALPAAVLTMVVYSVIGVSGTLDQKFSYDLIKIIPYIIVIVAAVLGFNVIIILLSGIFISGIIGFFTGSLTFISFTQAIQNGMSGMFSLVIIALLLRGITGLVKNMGGLDWLISKLTSNIKSRKGAEYGIAALISLIDAALANNTISILLAAPLTRNIAKEYNIAPKRIASLLDIFSCIVQGIIPHGGQMLLCIAIVGGTVSPISIIGYSYYLLFLVLASIITIQFGLLRTKDEKNGIKLYSDSGEVIEVKKV